MDDHVQETDDIPQGGSREHREADEIREIREFPKPEESHKSFFTTGRTHQTRSEPENSLENFRSPSKDRERASEC